MVQMTNPGTPHASKTRRELLRTFTLRAAIFMAASSLGASANVFADAAPSARRSGSGVPAYKLFTGPDNASHVLKGTINQQDRTAVVAVHFKESPAYSFLDWHKDPEPQFVITLSGTLEFTMRDGETFVLHPGDVLLAEDNTGSGHKWRLIDDQPWRRAYIVLKPGEKDSFVPETTSPAGSN